PKYQKKLALSISCIEHLAVSNLQLEPAVCIDGESRIDIFLFLFSLAQLINHQQGLYQYRSIFKLSNLYDCCLADHLMLTGYSCLVQGWIRLASMLLINFSTYTISVIEYLSSTSL
ncbi:hypothetical protein ACJX0J_035127, partial [Zea mays]